MSKKDKLIELIHAFSEVDSAKAFNFNSGHLGALTIADVTIVELLDPIFFQKIKVIILLAKELTKFVLLTIVPVKNLTLIVRLLLRKLCNKKPEIIYDMTVISLGNQPYPKDAYFGVLLNNIDEKFNYLKIVGGFTIKSNDYLFIESALSYSALAKLVLSILLSPIFSVWYLFNCARRLKGFNPIAIFIALGLNEINAVVLNNNKIIVESIRAWVKNKKTKKILFPLEGRNWEKNIVASMNVQEIYSIGYLHCALTPKHLSLIEHGFYDQNEIPSVIVAPSEMATKLLSNTFPATIVRQGFFLRASKSGNVQLKKDSNTLLFALTGNIAESCEIIDSLVKSGIEEIYQVIVRLNPNTSSYANLAKYVKKHGFALYTGKEDFLPNICFFRSSSVALEYLKLHVLPVYLSLNEVISNNTFELDHKYLFNILPISRDSKTSVAIVKAIQELVNDNLYKLSGGQVVSDYYLNSYKSLDSLTGLLD